MGANVDIQDVQAQRESRDEERKPGQPEAQQWTGLADQPQYAVQHLGAMLDWVALSRLGIDHFDRHLDNPQAMLARLELHLGLFLRLAAFRDFFAERARVFAIERPLHGFR